MEDQNTYLESSSLLDYSHPAIQQLVTSRGWDSSKKKFDLIHEIYTFVRDEIAYGYPTSFSLPASQTLSIQYGNSLTKGTLFMALLRAVGVPCRYHAMTVRKVILRGLLPPLIYKLAAKDPYQISVEVQYDNEWIVLEGHIVDRPYLAKLQQKFPDYMGSFYGYGIAVLNFKNPNNEWSKNYSFVQNRVTEEDLGNFATPDAFFAQHPESEAYTRSFRYRVLMRNRLNTSIRAVRGKDKASA